jgi:hypothetical protein
VGSSISDHGTAQEQVVRERSAMCAPSLSYPYSFTSLFNSRLYFIILFPFHYLLFFILSFLLPLYFSTLFSPILLSLLNALYPIPSLLYSTSSIPHPSTFLAHFPCVEEK